MKLAVLTSGWHHEVLRYTIDGITARAGEDDADVYVFNCYGEYNEENPFDKGEYNIFNLADFDEFDGVVLVSNMVVSRNIREALHHRIRLSGKPAISLEAALDGMDFIGVDNYAAMRELVEHIAAVHNVRSYAYVGGPIKGYESSRRYQAFRDVLIDHGIAFDESLYYVGNYRYAKGVEAAEDLCRRFPNADDLPQAVICANDEMAMGVCDVFFEHGIRIPEDIIVTGFDNYERSEEYSPTLTTVDRPKEEIGYRACDHLIRKIRGEQVPEREYLPTKVIHGESCGCRECVKRDDGLYRRKVLHSLNENNTFELNLRKMEEELTEGNTEQDLHDIICQHLKKFKISTFYLATKEGVGNNSVYALQRPGIVRGYSGKMYLRVAVNEGKEEECRYFSNITPILDREEHSKGDVYIFSPLHFRDKNIGYCVMKNSLYLINGNYLQNWLKVLDNTLESYSQKKKLIEANDKLNSMYIKDSLKGLYNRFGYAQEAITLFDQNQRNEQATTIIFADLDGLKAINDRFGHEFGDIAILSVAGTIKRIVPEEYIKIRYGGDEFLIIGTGGDEEKAREMIDRMEEDFKSNRENTAFPFELSASFGYVIAEADAQLPLSEYVEKADKLMYNNKQAKKASRGI